MNDTVRFHLSKKSSVPGARHQAAETPAGAAASAPPALRPFPGELAPARAALDPEEAREMEQAAHQLASGPGVQAVHSNRNDILRMAGCWAKKHEAAEAAGVDLRRSTFVNKLISSGAALIALGAAAALSVVTGGAALPLLLIASVRATVIVFDALCASVDWLGSKERPPVRMPLGANSLGNMLYGLGLGLGLSEERSKSLGRYGSGVLILGLSAAGLALAMPQEGMSMASAAIRYASSALTLLGAGRQAASNDQYDPVAKERDQAKADLHLALLEQAAQQDMDPAGFTAWCEGLRADLASQGMDAQTLVDLRKVIDAVAADVRAGRSVASPVGADRTNTFPRMVGDLLGLGAGANLVWTGLTQARALDMLQAV